MVPKTYGEKKFFAKMSMHFLASKAAQKAPVSSPSPDPLPQTTVLFANTFSKSNLTGRAFSFLLDSKLKPL